LDHQFAYALDGLAAASLGIIERDQGKRCEGSPRDSSLPALARFGLSSRNLDCGVPRARGMRRRLRERACLHRRRDQDRAAFGGIVVRRFCPPPYQPL